MKNKDKAKSDPEYGFIGYYRRDAKKHGIHEAIILNTIRMWVTGNMNAGKQRRNKHTWMWHSYRRFSEDLILSEKQVRIALENLVQSGTILKNKYNKLNKDRTLWYAIANEEEHFDNEVLLRAGEDEDENEGDETAHMPHRADIHANEKVSHRADDPAIEGIVNDDKLPPAALAHMPHTAQMVPHTAQYPALCDTDGVLCDTTNCPIGTTITNKYEISKNKKEIKKSKILTPEISPASNTSDSDPSHTQDSVESHSSSITEASPVLLDTVIQPTETYEQIRVRRLAEAKSKFTQKLLPDGRLDKRKYDDIKAERAILNEAISYMDENDLDNNNDMDNETKDLLNNQHIELLIKLHYGWNEQTWSPNEADRMYEYSRQPNKFRDDLKAKLIANRQAYLAANPEPVIEEPAPIVETPQPVTVEPEPVTKPARTPKLTKEQLEVFGLLIDFGHILCEGIEGFPYVKPPQNEWIKTCKLIQRQLNPKITLMQNAKYFARILYFCQLKFVEMRKLGNQKAMNWHVPTMDSILSCPKHYRSILVDFDAKNTNNPIDIGPVFEDIDSTKQMIQELKIELNII
jgi:hypothetical protein